MMKQTHTQEPIPKNRQNNCWIK